MGKGGIVLAFFFCGALCTAASVSVYTERASSAGFAIRVFELDTNPFTADHQRDLAKFRSDVLEDIANNPYSARLFFGYSAGAKFAARLASEDETAADGVFLLDPVDGPPPLQKNLTRFPIFLEAVTPAWRNLRKKNQSDSPSALKILHTEFGERGGFGGVPCVSRTFSHLWYAERMGARADESVLLDNVGHLDPLSQRPAFPGNIACPGGTQEAAAQARENALGSFEALLTEIQFSNSSLQH
jgi:pimeloyl-ACP methyl ester carboxylesterase